MTSTSILNSPIVSTIITLVGMAFITFINIRNNKNNNSKEALKQILAEKDDKKDCTKFKTRIGDESDKHRDDIVNLEKDMIRLNPAIDN